MFFGWRVVAGSFVVAVFAWGIGFYGPPIYMETIHASRGWPIALISAAITVHFLLGAVIVANLATLHRVFGLAAATRAGAVATGLGLIGWAWAQEPWQLFAATLLSASGWATTSGAALNAMISPWFVRRRPAALSMAFNGASMGGVVFSPLWVLLISQLGFRWAAVVVAASAMGVLWVVASTRFETLPRRDGAVCGWRFRWRKIRYPERRHHRRAALGTLGATGASARLLRLLRLVCSPRSDWSLSFFRSWCRHSVKPAPEERWVSQPPALSVAEPYWVCSCIPAPIAVSLRLQMLDYRPSGH